MNTVVWCEVAEILIRKAKFEDATAIAGLAEELGYSVSEFEIASRLPDLACILVAELDHHVVGWVDVSIATHLISGPFGEIGGLVVSSNVRGKKIGSRLTAAAEEWIKQNGVDQCVVRSRSTRLDAHRFYLREGYTLEKTSAVFGKKLE